MRQSTNQALRLNGIPLWDNLEEEITKELKPSCQVNYNFIKRV